MADKSFHFIPSHRAEYFSKIKYISADHIIFDLEDGVPQNLIYKGKENILNFINNLGSSNNNLNNIWIRIHDIESKHFKNDLEFIRQLPDIGLIIPKFKPCDWKNYPINKKKIILIESLDDLNQISLFSNELKKINLFAMGLGLEDMLSEFYQPNESLKYLTNQIKAYFVITNKPICSILLDCVFTNYRDNILFNDDCQDSFSFGFNGRFSIHPNQIDIINNTYIVGVNAYKHAQKIISLSKNSSHTGYSIIDGVLITPPKVAKSKTILKKGSTHE
jgi:citrate lyase subunit beta / citryl-CoA lyase